MELIGETSSGVISTRVVGIGNGGDITINTDRFRSQNGGGIFANVNGGSGQGGKVLINATEFIEMSRPNPLSTRNSIGSSAVTGTGNAGSITLNTGRLSVLDGTIVSTSTFGFGNAGQLTVNADFVEVNGFYDNSTTPTPGSIRAGAFQLDPIARRIFNLPDFPTGNAGSVTINARNINITARGQVTVQNDGIGDAGDLKINADSLLIRNDAGITASTASGEGGNIGFNLQDSLVMRDGSFISATAGGTGNGGNINISSPVIVGLENSDIIANAFQGNGGNINITTQGIFGLQFRDSLTPESDITASSQFGVSGTVDIKNFGIDPNSGLAELSVKLADASQKVATGCADTRGSSFIATGRGGIPQNPNQQVNTNRTWSDIRDLSAYRQNNPVAAKLLKTPETLIEATFWRRNADGKIELVADNSSTQVQPSLTCSGIAQS